MHAAPRPTTPARRAALVACLADGAWHSGEAVASVLGVSRTAVWKHAAQLEDWGLQLEREPGHGYRLARPLSLLDPAALHAGLSPATAGALRELQVAVELPSTNAALLAVTDLPPGRFDLCLAEFQQAGRGRRGRAWQSPYAAGLCFSMSWSFAELPAALGALSLATGVAVLQALASCGLDDGLQLKWPNDVLWRGRKLGGILIELRAEAGGPGYVVIGIGLNVDLPEATRAAVAATGLEVADLREVAAAAGMALPSRTRLAGLLADAVYAMLLRFTREGFAPFAGRWREADALRGRAVRLIEPTRERAGTAQGIEDDGALLVAFAPGAPPERVVAGEVSLRPA